MKLNYPITPEQVSELDRLNKAEGSVRCVEDILRHLRRGELNWALSIRVSEGDKTRQYPEIEEQLHQMFGCRSHQVRGCEHDLCLSVRRWRLERLERLAMEQS